jgi:hypothetical protein
MPRLSSFLSIADLLRAGTTASELAGYVPGAGTASERPVNLGFRRERFTSEADRQDLLAQRSVLRGLEGTA